MKQTTLAALNEHVLTEAFNTVYEHYVVPLRFSVEQMQRHVATNSIVLEHSPLWLDDDGSVVGLGMLGVRGERGWIGGFGIAPSARGHGLSHKLIMSVLERAASIGLRQVQLEVLTHNPAAIQVYKRAGFVVRRDLQILVRAVSNSLSMITDDTVQPLDVARLLPFVEGLHETVPVWQREVASLAEMTDLQALAIGAASSPIGYVIYSATDTDLRIADIAAQLTSAIPRLLAALTQRLPNRRMSLNNEPAESAVCAALEHDGWREVLRQHEMVYTFNQP